MKARYKQRMMEQRDEKAFNLILWFVLNAMYHEPYGWGKIRLQRLYDTVIMHIYGLRDDLTVGPEIESWAQSMGLTEQGFRERNGK